MIIIYTMPHCGFCEVLKHYLNKKDIVYTECKDTDTMISKGFVSTPQLELEDGTILKYTEALAWVKAQGDK